MTDEQNQAGNKQNVTIRIPEDIEAGTYANAISVHFNNNEAIIDFAYRLAHTKDRTVKVVSRVNMSHKTAESLLKVLSNAMLDFKNKQEKNEQQ